MKPPKPTKLFNLKWIAGPKRSEMVMYQQPKPLILWKIKQLRKTTHKNGRFEIMNKAMRSAGFNNQNFEI